MSYLERIQAKAALKAVGGSPAKGAKGGSDPFAGSLSPLFRGLPDDCADGLTRLETIPAPRITRPEVWLAIVADAVRLASDGWAAQALGLGWSPFDLWGCSPIPGGNADHDGLAVWIDGRRVLLLDRVSCIVEAGPAARAVFNRSSVAAGGTLLWRLGDPA